MCRSVFPHQKSKISRGKSNKDMDKHVDKRKKKKKGETSAGSKEGGLQPKKHIYY